MNDLLGGRYRLGNPLGRGGMGTVYEAVQEGLGRRVAVKLLDERLSYDREQLERFRREAEVVAALGHPNIVQVTDFQYPDDLGKQPYIVMELLRGESLGHRIDREVLSAQRVAFIAAQALSALTAAHAAGVVHRDIKPDNIFLLADAAVPDTVKVLDFGIAKLTSDASIGSQQKLTSTNAMLGTPAFMAPEQARGEPDVDARADIYAIGATMYQALTGRLPFEAASVPALLFSIVEKNPQPLLELRPDLPPDFVAVVERAMAKDRAARFQDADAMRRALAPWSGLPASVPPPISATAATVASGRIAPHDPATPIVVHHTPAPATKPATSAPPPSTARSGPSPLLVIAGLLVAGMFTAVAIVYIASNAHRSTGATSDLPPPPSVPSFVASPGALATAAAPSATAIVAPSASATIETHVVASAVVAPPKAKRYGGTTGFLSSKDFSSCKDCDWQAFGNEMGMRVPQINACFAASEHEPPLHENPDYVLRVDEHGAISLVKAQDGAPKLDSCLTGVVKSVGVKGGSGTIGVSFRGECTKLWPNHCD